MSFKKFSTTHDAPGKEGSADKSKDAAPAAQPDQKPAAAAPVPKS